MRCEGVESIGDLQQSTARRQPTAFDFSEEQRISRGSRIVPAPSKKAFRSSFNLREGVADYLELRRSLGFKLRKDERLLLDFAEFMERRGATWITSTSALAWAQQPESTDPNYLVGRLRAVRSFAALSHRDRPAHRDSANGSAAAATKFLPASYPPPRANRPPSRRQSATTAGSQADLALAALYDLRPAESHPDACQRGIEP